MLFKNHNNILKNINVVNLEEVFLVGKLNYILYSDPFVKAGFIAKLVQDTKLNILYLDLDLLYSGYLKSKILETPHNLTLLQSTNESWNKHLTKTLQEISTKKSLVIIDSINGLYNILERNKEVGRLVTSYIMLIASMARKTNSYVAVASLVRFKKQEGWILSPTGGRLVETKIVNKIFLEQNESGIVLNFLDVKEKALINAGSIPL